MTYDDDELTSKQNSRSAAIDRQRHDVENKKNFFLNEIAVAEDMLPEIRGIFFRSHVHLNYNKKDIVIKVNLPKKADLMMATKLDAKLMQAGVTLKILKNTNRIYHLPRLTEVELTHA